MSFATPQHRATILSRIREAHEKTGPLPVPGSLPDNGARALPITFSGQRDRTAAFAEHMEKLGCSFALCDSRADVAEGLTFFARRAGWTTVTALKSDNLAELLRDYAAPLTWTSADCGTARLAVTDVAIVEADAADAQFGSIFCAGTPGGLELVSLAPTLIVIVFASRLHDSAAAAYDAIAAHHGGKLPPTLTVLTGPAQNHTVERRAIPRGHGPQSITVYLVPG